MSITRTCRRRSSAAAARSDAVGPAAARSDAVGPAFRMVAAGFGPGPAVAYFGTFWETNVRLYSIDATDRHGIVFCSLDASRVAVVSAARPALGLPHCFRGCVATTESTTVR